MLKLFKKIKLFLYETILNIWYQKTLKIFYWLFYPLELIYRSIIDLRILLYKYKILKTHKFKVPVIVVGNITTGGTGKTPMVYYLANYFQEHGFKPGVVLRGYKGKIRSIHVVTKDADPKLYGDEAVLLANNLNCPVIIGKDRVKSINFLLMNNSVNIIICDDGLQHYALFRDLEIMMVDGERYFGNLHQIPLGPLRENLHRLNTVDFIVVSKSVYQDPATTKTTDADLINDEEPQVQFRSQLQQDLPKISLKKIGSKLYCLKLQPEKIYNLNNNSLIKDPKFFSKVHAVAGIGNNNKFFKLLNYLGIETINHSFPDHYEYKVTDLDFTEDFPVIMTEKDAVKCLKLAKDNFWYLKITPTMDLANQFNEHLENLL